MYSTWLATSLMSDAKPPVDPVAGESRTRMRKPSDDVSMYSSSASAASSRIWRERVVDVSDRVIVSSRIWISRSTTTA